MIPFRDYDLRKIIAKQYQSVQNAIDSMSNEEIMANDLDILADNIYQRFFIEPVTIFEEDFAKRSIEQGKIQKRVNPFFRDFTGYGYEYEYVEIDGIIAVFYFPYQGEKTLFQCQASTISMGRYPDITVDKSTISFHFERPLDETNSQSAIDNLLKDLERNLKEIKDGLSYANKDVTDFNNDLKSQALKSLVEKRKKVEAYFSIAKMLEVPIEKKEYAKTHIPLQRKIVPVATHYESSDYYGISDIDYKEILTTIKHTGSTFERTPASYKTLHEENLRDILLAALNATYQGDATGETFRNDGKTDICIERKDRSAFVAECKMWTGQKAVSKAIEQLDSYLTWRDCKTALIYFVRRKDFMNTLKVAEAALRGIDRMRNVYAVDKNEFDCSFLSSANPGQLIKMRVMLFNLYCAEEGKVEP